MSYIVAATPVLGQNSYTISRVLQLMSSEHPPTEIAFPVLGGGGTSLTTGQGASIWMGEIPNVVRSVGLLSCASFCFVNENGRGYGYHGNVGVLPEAEFKIAMREIGAPPYDAVLIAVAHPGDTGETYQRSIADLVRWGIPTENIVEITDIAVFDMFGLNNWFQIGY